MSKTGDIVFTPEMMIDHIISERNLTINDIGIAPIVVISWSRKIIINLAKMAGARLSPNWSLISNGFISYTGQLGNNCVSFVHIPEGASATVVSMENMIACGAKVIIGIGWAGSLSPAARLGSIIIPTGCISEEGTSQHYLNDSTDIKPDKELLTLLQSCAMEKGVNMLSGIVWTTDAIYRELNYKIMMYRNNGVLGVDMETSAMYAVGIFRNVRVCNLLVISDELDDRWQPGFNTPDFENGLRYAQEIVLYLLESQEIMCL